MGCAVDRPSIQVVWPMDVSAKGRFGMQSTTAYTFCMVSNWSSIPLHGDSVTPRSSRTAMIGKSNYPNICQRIFGQLWMESLEFRLPDISTGRSRGSGHDRGELSIDRRRLSACTDARQCDGACWGSGVECGCYQVGREIDGCGCFGLSRRYTGGL